MSQRFELSIRVDERMAIEYRRFQPSDEGKCRELILTCADEIISTCIDGFDNLPFEVRERLRRTLRPHFYKEALDSMFCVVAETDGEVVAVGALDGTTIKRMNVRDKLRGKGIGKAICERLEAEARRRGLAALDLRASLNAVGFYDRLGFIRVGEKTWTLDGPILRMVLMSKNLSGLGHEPKI